MSDSDSSSTSDIPKNDTCKCPGRHSLTFSCFNTDTTTSVYCLTCRKDDDCQEAMQRWENIHKIKRNRDKSDD